MFKHPALLAAIVLVLATVAAYLPALRAGFVWDDDFHVTENAALRARLAPHGADDLPALAAEAIELLFDLRHVAALPTEGSPPCESTATP